MLKVVSELLCFLCCIFLIMLLFQIDKSGRLDKLISRKEGSAVIRYDWLKPLFLVLCVVVPCLLFILLPNLLSCIICGAFDLFYIGYRLGLSKGGPAE